MATNNATNTSNPITVAQGGTGVATHTTAYGTLCAGTTATGPEQTVSPGSSGAPLVSGGASALPSYTTLLVGGGGTGVTTLTTAYGTLCAGTTATGTVQTVSPGSSGAPLVSGGASALPSYTTLAVGGGGTGLTTSTTAYGVVCAGTTATGAYQVLSALGASGTILTSNGAAALPSFQAAAGGASGLTKIATATASASATISFAAGITSTYDNYLIIIENLLPDTDGVYLKMLVGTGAGPTYQTSGYSGLYAAIYGAGTTYTLTANTTTLFYLSGTASSATNELIGSNTTETGSWQILISGANTANDKTIMHSAAYYGYNSSRFDTICNGVGRWQGAAVLTSLQFALSSGNMTSGTFKLYGYQN